MTTVAEMAARERAFLALQGVHVPQVGERGLCAWGYVPTHRAEVVVISVAPSGMTIRARFVRQTDADKYGGRIVRAGVPWVGFLGTLYNSKRKGTQIAFGPGLLPP